MRFRVLLKTEKVRPEGSETQHTLMLLSSASLAQFLLLLLAHSKRVILAGDPPYSNARDLIQT